MLGSLLLKSPNRARLFEKSPISFFYLNVLMYHPAYSLFSFEKDAARRLCGKDHYKSFLQNSFDVYHRAYSLVSFFFEKSPTERSMEKNHITIRLFYQKLGILVAFFWERAPINAETFEKCLFLSGLFSKGAFF